MMNTGDTGVSVAKHSGADTNNAQAPGIFTILVVCTGNICRSPLAEQLLRAELVAAGIEARVLSAGVYAQTNQPMTPEAIAHAARLGVTATPHRAQMLTRELVEQADLVLGATRQHRSAAVALHPRANRYSYTLAQFARLLTAEADAEAAEQVEHAEAERERATDPRSRLTAALGAVDASRGFHPQPVDLSIDDIDDPYRQSDAVWKRVADELGTAVRTIAGTLAERAAR